MNVLKKSPFALLLTSNISFAGQDYITLPLIGKAIGSGVDLAIPNSAKLPMANILKAIFTLNPVEYEYPQYEQIAKTAYMGQLQIPIDFVIT